MIRVEVAYALPERQVCIGLDVAAGSSIAEVLDAAMGRKELAGLNWREHSVGIFGRVLDPSVPVAAGDRVEIYRPLQMDAKAARRQRAALQRARSRDR